MNTENIYMVVLAKSYKARGYCIAGKRLLRNDNGCFICTGQWVRPVAYSGPS